MIRKIIAIAKQDAREGLYYRFDLLLYICNFMIQIAVYVFIWLAIYNQGNQILGMSFEQVTTYYILVVSLDPIIGWGINEILGEAIRDGQVLRELLHPISFFSYYFGIRIGELVEAGIVGIITFLLCAILFGIVLPQSLFHFCAFLVVIVLSIIVIYFFEMILSMSAFYTNSVWGIEILKRAIISIFSGMIAPLTLFPEWVQKIANFLPFQECIYTPINIYFGELSNIEILQTIIKQGIWITVLYLLAKFIFHKAIKNITINGG